MLKLITLVIVLFSMNTFASTNGGGLLMSVSPADFGNEISLIESNGTSESTHGGGVLASSPEIVFHMGQKNGLVKFAYAQLVDKQWQVEKIEMPAAELSGQQEVLSALANSQSLKTWAPLK